MVTKKRIRAVYKKEKSVKKTYLKLKGVTYKEVREAIISEKLTKRDRYYIKLLVENKVKKNKKEAINYVIKTKQIRSKEKRQYGYEITEWEDPYPLELDEIMEITWDNIIKFLSSQKKI
ncbi:MAG: hypothetical protein ACP6IY_22525 [Promethearchaeia archaeon]